MKHQLAITAAISLVIAASAIVPTGTADQRAPSAGALRKGVVAALQANRRLAVRVLWTNRIPPNARQSTRGPALASLRASGKDRQQKELRMRMLHQTFRIVSIHLNRRATTATAVVQWNQDVEPSHLNGKPIGRPIAVQERARILLHRIGVSRRFVVWNVGLVR